MLVLRSVVVKQTWVSDSLGSKGVPQVKMVKGLVECDSIVRESVGGVGLAKL